MLLVFERKGSHVKDVNRPTTLYATVPFARNHRWKRTRQRRNLARARRRITAGNLNAGLQTTKKATTCISVVPASKPPSASWHICAKLAGGTTLWPIVNTPLTAKIKSTFNSETWKHNLRDHHDQNFVNELINGIDNGVQMVSQNLVNLIFQLITSLHYSTLQPSQRNWNANSV